MRKPSIGTISHGTLRMADLLPAVMDEYERLRSRRSLFRILRDYRYMLDKDFDFETCQTCTCSTAPECRACDADEAYNIITLALENIALPFTYFGSTEGDGSDVGFWPIDVAEIIASGEVWQDPGNGSKCPKGYAYRIIVSDHGNVSLYYRNGRQVWSIV